MKNVVSNLCPVFDNDSLFENDLEGKSLNPHLLQFV